MMKNRMVMFKCLTLFTLLFSSTFIFAQIDGPEEPMFDNDRRPSSRPGRLFGKIVDANNKGVEAASIQVFIPVSDSSGRGRRDSLVAGMLTKPNGDFSFYNLALPDSFSILISAIGFGDIRQSVQLESSGDRSRRSLQNFEKDLGNIKLGGKAESLEAVTVVAERPVVQMGIDRKIFNVEKSLTSTGGTAIDVMRNIPSLSVDVEGNVQLRNTAPQIFVDGRPTILTLEQIPADDIERVELITNPSAKFDAASTGGIINIILKKNRRLGLNGMASIGAGYPDILNGNLSLNLRQGKFNFFVSGNYNQSGGKAKSETFRQNKVGGVLMDYFNQESETERTRRFQSIRGGVDFFIDNRNTISLSQQFVQGKFGSEETQDQQYFSQDKVLMRNGERFSEYDGQFNRSNTALYYRHDFPKKGREITADISYNSGDGGNDAIIRNFFYYPDGTQFSQPSTVRNEGSNDNSQLTMQLDFVNPITENSKFETGVRTFINDYKSIFNAYALEGAEEMKLPLSNNYAYKETVHAGYFTYTSKWKSIGYQIGLRAEYSNFEGELVDSAKNFGYTYPNSIDKIWDAVFPGIYLTKQITDDQEIQLNYSRRIRRPNFWQLNPYVDINDPLNISRGNPELRPEYTNSMEFNYSKRYDKGNFLGVLYYRNNQADITRYSDTITAAQLQQLNNAAIDPNAILNTFINVRSTNRMGAEFTLQHKLAKNLELVPNINLQYRIVNADVIKPELTNEGLSWEGKLIVNYKITTPMKAFNNIGIQLMSEYESREVFAQGVNKAQFSTDLAFRKEFLKNNAGTFTFAINDLFNTNRFGQIYDTESFYQDSYRRRNVRNFRVSFSYRFGKRDLFKRNEERRERRQGDDDE